MCACEIFMIDRQVALEVAHAGNNGSPSGYNGAPPGYNGGPVGGIRHLVSIPTYVKYMSTFLSPSFILDSIHHTYLLFV